MKVLIVCSCTSGQISGPFIEEQVNSLKKLEVEFDYFLIKGKGIKAYIKSYFRYIKKIWRSDYDLIHAHYGFSGLMASCQFIKPVITTFHGSDINIIKNRKYSKTAYIFSRFSIFVDINMPEKIGAKRKFAIIPCGTDINIFYALEKEFCRQKLNIAKDIKIALFSAGFNEQSKNYPLAKIACEGINELTLLELKGFSRDKVNLLLNACELLLVTSVTEGSPQIIKEAMACNCPIISTDVGDVKIRIKGVENCYITSFNSEEISEKIQCVLSLDKRTNGRIKLVEEELDMGSVAKKIFNIYKFIIKNKEE